MMDLTSEAILLSMMTFYFGVKLYLVFIAFIYSIWSLYCMIILTNILFI